MECNRPPDHLFMCDPPEVRPFAIELNCFVEGDARDISGDGADPFSGNSDLRSNSFRRVLVGQVLLCHVVQNRAVRETCVPPAARQIRFDPCFIESSGFAGASVDHQCFARLIPEDQAELVGRLVTIHKTRSVSQPRKILEVDLASLHQAMNKA